MADKSHPVAPPRAIDSRALEKVGIRSISDNLPVGAGIDVATPFMRIFGDEIEAALARRNAKKKEAS